MANDDNLGVEMNIDNVSYKKILDSLQGGVYFVNRDRVITYWNDGAEKISGFSSDEVVGRSCSDNILTHVDFEGNSLCLGLCPLGECIACAKPGEMELYLHHKMGHRIPVSVRTNALTDTNGNVIGGVELFIDISNQNANELRVKELEKLALLDRLTQLANRHFIEIEIQNRFEEYKRFNMPFGILFMDIDFFRIFNNTYGHDIGDEVLKHIARTFVANSRPFDLFGRWGGEEFLGIIRNISPHDLEQLGNKLRLLVENSYLPHGNEQLRVTISLGATLVRDDDTIDSLIKRADTLLYESKNAGRNRLTFG